MCSPVEIVEEGEDEEGQLAPGLLQAELERVAVHHRRWVVQQLFSVRWGVKVPTTEGKTTSRVVDPFQTQGGEVMEEEDVVDVVDDGEKWGRYGKRWFDELG